MPHNCDGKISHIIGNIILSQIKKIRQVIITQIWLITTLLDLLIRKPVEKPIRNLLICLWQLAKSSADSKT